MYLVYVFKKNINHKDLHFILCVYYCYLFEMQFEAIGIVTTIQVDTPRDTNIVTPYQSLNGETVFCSEFQ